MYVYLTSDGKNTFIGTASEPAACHIATGWRLYMALEVSGHMNNTVMQKWKRESRGLTSRISKGFQLAKHFFLTVHVSDLPVAELKILNQYKAPAPDAPKAVPDSFWKNV